jgi:hypothetical protein
MKSALLLAFAFCFCAAASAQDSSGAKPDSPGITWDKNPTAKEGPVALADEPHHRLIFQNDYVVVYDVEVYADNSTLLHHHDLPYIIVAMGQAGFTNVVEGKPAVHVSLQDSEARFSQPPVVHVVKADSGLDFHNITVEFKKPQQAAKNLCAKLMEGPLACPEKSEATEQAAKSAPAKPAMKNAKSSVASAKKVAIEKNAAADSPAADPPPSQHMTPYFETDQLRIDLVRVSGSQYGGSDYKETSPKLPALLLPLDNASLEADLGTQRNNYLHGGEVMWLPAGTSRAIHDFLGDGSLFLLISFKDTGN